jgi:hypothetical protein
MITHFASPFKGMYPLDQTLTYLLLPYHILRDILNEKDNSFLSVCEHINGVHY